LSRHYCEAKAKSVRLFMVFEHLRDHDSRFEIGHSVAKPMRFYALLAVSTILILRPALLHSQVYSYLDENGVRVLTNLPPTGPVRDLKVSGVMPTSTQSVPAQRRQGYGTTNKNLTSPIALTQSQANSLRNNGAPSVSAAGQVRRNPIDYDPIIEKYAAEFRMDADLIRSIIAAESAFNEKAVSPKGAQGLMQLMPETASRLGVRNSLDPEENIWGGTKYMRFLYDTFSGSPDALKLSLAAYNAGENLVLQLGRVPAIKETNDYVRSIIERYGQPTMKNPDSVPEEPQIFLFIDQNGVLNLTNIPPAEQSGSIRTYVGSSRVFR